MGEAVLPEGNCHIGNAMTTRGDGRADQGLPRPVGPYNKWIWTPQQVSRPEDGLNLKMDILNLSAQWAKSEVFSARIVWLFSIIEMLAAIGFWYLGRTPMAKAFIWPLLVAGVFIALVGVGLFLANNPRIDQFERKARLNPDAFVQSEIQRTEKSQRELSLVFKILPVVIVLAAIVILAAPASIWRAIAIIVIINVALLMMVDSNTEARNNIYHHEISTSPK